MWNRRRFLATSAAVALAPRAFTQPAPTQTAPLLFIDSHVHVWKTDPAFPFAAGAHPSPADASVEMLLDLMHANNVSRTVLIQVIHYKWDNSYLASVLKRFPGQFHGVCRVNPETPPHPTSSPASPRSRASVASASAPPPAPRAIGSPAR